MPNKFSAAALKSSPDQTASLPSNTLYWPSLFNGRYVFFNSKIKEKSCIAFQIVGGEKCVRKDVELEDSIIFLILVTKHELETTYSSAQSFL